MMRPAKQAGFADPMQEFSIARLPFRTMPRTQGINPGGVTIDTHHLKTRIGKAQGIAQAQLTQADH